MVYQPPTGARDLLPLDVAQKRWIEKRLQQVFHAWGYHRIITSTLERLDTLMAGGAIQRSTVLNVQTVDDEVLGLRPELTASIARTAVTRMAGAIYPQRLYYNGNVFRRAESSNHNRQVEFHQSGVELLGGEGLLADGEVLLLLRDCLQSLGLADWHLVLGEAELTRSLLSVFPERLRAQVRTHLARLDRVALEELPMEAALKERALLLLDLRGRPADVLQRVSQLDLSDAQRAIVSNLKSLMDLLSSSFASLQDSAAGPEIILDLSLVQTFDYYTGIVFEVVQRTETGTLVLAQGGRYDQLLGVYHPQGETKPGIGFSLNLEDLQQSLLPTGQLPQETVATDWLVVPAGQDAFAIAFRHAQTLRASEPETRVEVYLHSSEAPDAVRDYARSRRIGQVAWVSATGEASTEAIA